LKKTAADTWSLDTSTFLTAAVTSVAGTAPIVSSGGAPPAISISAAATGAAGSMSAADKTKLDGVASGATANTGTVTTASIVSANGFAGTVATASTTPAVTLTTSITGVLKGNGTAISAAVAGTDYLAPAAIGTTVQAYDADLTTWGAKVAPSGTVVGTTDTQTLSGKTITALKETKVAMGAVDLDMSAGNAFTKTVAATTTFTVSNVPATGTFICILLDLTNGGSQTVTFWTGVKWASGTVPTLTAAGRDVLGFFAHDGGTTWTGVVISNDAKCVYISFFLLRLPATPTGLRPLGGPGLTMHYALPLIARATSA